MAPGDTRQLKQEVEERGFGLEEGTLEGLGRGTEETVEGSAGSGGVERRLRELASWHPPARVGGEAGELSCSQGFQMDLGAPWWPTLGPLGGGVGPTGSCPSPPPNSEFHVCAQNS